MKRNVGLWLVLATFAMVTLSCASFMRPPSGLVTVTISKDCRVNLDSVMIEGREMAGAADPGRPSMVRWQADRDVEDLWEVQVIPLPPAGQDSASKDRGRLIKSRIKGGGTISFKAKHPSRVYVPTPPANRTEADLLWNAKGAYRWKYEVKLFDENDEKQCGEDPEVCVRRPGGSCMP